MVELRVKRSTGYNSTFHFHTMHDCRKFLKVFEDRLCNVPWERPIIVPDSTKLSEYEQNAINEDPEIRAERDLGWGWNLARLLGRDVQNKQQKELINSIMKKFM